VLRITPEASPTPYFTSAAPILSSTATPVATHPGAALRIGTFIMKRNAANAQALLRRANGGRTDRISDARFATLKRCAHLLRQAD
jgi:hypothetical protein